ncbi:MAG: magnesium and cobalt transport protein CorA [Gulosibacter sp.]|uniref:magnesium and cobalt transport protein CorA n=1 Tax=Gulosibacter sp. TaxID=2817531 RepID=UPI003F91BDBA
MPNHRPNLFGFSSASKNGQPAKPGSSAAREPITRYIVDGHLVDEPEHASVADALHFSETGENRTALVYYPGPTPEQVAELATAWSLHPVLVEDLLIANQRPKVERYGEALFVVIRSARYLDDIEEVEFAEFHLLVRPGAVVVLCQDGHWFDGSDEPNLEDAHPFSTSRRGRPLLSTDELLALGPEAVLYRAIDDVVDGYPPILRGLEIDKEEIERQVFSGDAAVAERIYRLSQEVIEMQQTLSSMTEVVDSLRAGFDKYQIPDALQAYLDDVADHLTHATSQVRDLRDALTQILSVNSTLVAQRQNEDMKKISGWAAILFAPTLVGAIYGMNFDDMPELHWSFGYPMALGLMLLVAVVLFIVFKKSKWM